MEKYNRFSEIMWLLLTITTTALVVFLMVTEKSVNKSKWYLVIPLLSAAIYIMRRGLRKRFEKQKEADRSNHSKAGK